jgi:hypothetical protein
MAKEANTAIQKSPLSLVPPPSDTTPATAGELDESEEQARSPLTKVAIGAGVATGAGLLGFGIYKLGKWAGWWGSSAIVIDDLPVTPADDSKPSDGDRGGGGSGSKRATGKLPNPSGDPEGYNTTLFPAPLPVRLTMKLLGYSVPFSTDSLYENELPNAEVSRFQREWNKVIKAIDAGTIMLPTSPSESKWTGYLRGVLDVDGVAGKQTLNGLEIAAHNQTKNGLKWTALVSKAG